MDFEQENLDKFRKGMMENKNEKMLSNGLSSNSKIMVEIDHIRVLDKNLNFQKVYVEVQLGSKSYKTSVKEINNLIFNEKFEMYVY